MPRKDRKLSAEQIELIAERIRDSGGSWREVGKWAKEQWYDECPTWQRLATYPELKEAMRDRHKLAAHEARSVLLTAQPNVCNGVLERLRFMQDRMAKLEQDAANGGKLPGEYTTLATQFRYYAKVYSELAGELGKASGESPTDASVEATTLEDILARLNIPRDEAKAAEGQNVQAERYQAATTPLRLVPADDDDAEIA